MRILNTQDQKHYRRWINVIPNLFIPGSAQFLAGRKLTGLILYVASLVLKLSVVPLVLNEQSTYTVNDLHWIDVVGWIFLLGVIIDGCRQRIPRLGFKRWSIFFAHMVLNYNFSSPANTTILGTSIQNPNGCNATNPHGKLNGRSWEYNWRRPHSCK